MSDQGPRLMNIGGMLIGPTPQPPAHLQNIDTAAADAAWRQSNGSMAAYHTLLQEHNDGVINLLSKNPMRITRADAPDIEGVGDPRFTDTGGAVVGEPGTIQTVAPGSPQAGEPTADQVSPLSENEREMLAELRAKPEGELSQSDAANLRALSDREEALANDAGGSDQRPLTRRQETRLATLRDIPEADRTPEQNTELAALAARERV